MTDRPSQDAQRQSVATFRLRRRRESVTALEVIERLMLDPTVMPDTIKDVERALDEIAPQ